MMMIIKKKKMKRLQSFPLPQQPPPPPLQSPPTHSFSSFPCPTPPHLSPFSSTTSEISSRLLLLHILKLESGQSLHLAHLFRLATRERDAACHHCPNLLLLSSSSFQIHRRHRFLLFLHQIRWPPPLPIPPNPLASSSSSTKSPPSLPPPCNIPDLN